MISSKSSGVRVDPQALAPLKTLSPARFCAALAVDYAVIGLCLVIGHATLGAPVWTWVLWPALWMVIASRQHALLILMHDTAHTLAFRRSTINDAIGELLCAGPLFISMFTYRRDHLAHHKWTNESEDPDWRFKLEDPQERPYWLFPRNDRSVLYWLKLWAHAVVFSFKILGGNLKGARNKAGLNPLAKRLVQARLASYVVLAIVLTVFGLWIDYLLFWVLPAFTVLPFMLRLRSIAEHFGLSYETELTETRTVKFRSRAEQFMFAPHNVSFHLDHHLYSAVPFYRATDLHALLEKDPAYKNGAHINDGYFIGARTLNHDLKTIRASRDLWPAGAA